MRIGVRNGTAVMEILTPTAALDFHLRHAEATEGLEEPVDGDFEARERVTAVMWPLWHWHSLDAETREAHPEATERLRRYWVGAVQAVLAYRAPATDLAAVGRVGAAAAVLLEEGTALGFGDAETRPRLRRLSDAGDPATPR